MRITERSSMLELPGNGGPMYPTLLWDEKELFLLDSGLPGQLDLLREAVKEEGFALEQLTALVITHQDMDHIGCAKELALLGIPVWAYTEETPYVEGSKPLVKLAAMEAKLTELSQEQYAFYQRLKAGTPRLYTCVDRLLHDGEILPIAGGVQVIHTPGHTPGHIALYAQESGLLICGDAANIDVDAWVGANPVYTQDMAQAELSLEKLKALKPKAVICYHGGYLEL